MPTTLDDYEFDLRGFLVVPGALSPAEVDELNAAYDRFPALANGDRTNPGERRVVILRYGPPWSRSRFGYTVSDELLERLTPSRRQIMQPMAPHPQGSTRVPLDLHSAFRTPQG